MKLSQNISNSNLYLRFRNKKNSLALKSIYTLAKSTCKYFYIMYIIQNCILCEFPWGPATTSWQIRHIVVVIVILHCDWFFAPQCQAISGRKFPKQRFLDNLHCRNDLFSSKRKYKFQQDFYSHSFNKYGFMQFLKEQDMLANV